MKTYIEFKDGTGGVVADAAPSINVEDWAVDCINRSCDVVSEAYALDDIKQIVFEPDEPDSND